METDGEQLEMQPKENKKRTGIQERYNAAKNLRTSLQQGPLVSVTPPQHKAYSTVPSQAVDSVFGDEENVYRQRQMALAAGCETYAASGGRGDTKMPPGQHVIVDDKHRLLYCVVPRAGSTSWLRLLIALRSDAVGTTSATNVHDTHGFRTFTSFEPRRRQQLLRDYTKLLVARDPYERVLSAYFWFVKPASEFNGPFAQLYPPFQRSVAKRYGRGDVTLRSDGGANVTFAAFVRYVTDPRTRRADPLSLLSDGSMNPHWMPITDRCHPCTVRYNVIAHHETLMADTEYTLRRMNASGLFEFPTARDGPSTRSQLAHYYSQLNEEEVARLRRLYEQDFKLFQYNDIIPMSGGHL
ncbi:PREDICTED: carbohydrate sulfotransferase 13-like [Priapulus caudatus]|uniref:Carbohydrate sulfotransferase n=1 Tax=Priapulus caudatus TaxID=37621 RepID=A0ABM1E653_PRICU|nr:PREDICTED: carbohydrate sulfotransferase 13-like [Priapulus caudatus]